MSKLPVVGDVITSPKFAFGYRDSEETQVITIDGETTTHVVDYPISDNERLNAAAKSGNPNQPITRDVDLGAYDKSRSSAEFVVTRAVSEGGGTGMGPGDIFPDGWHITAKRLTNKGKYNPKGETIQFYITGSFTCMVDKKDVGIVRHMDMSFS